MGKSNTVKINMGKQNNVKNKPEITQRSVRTSVLIESRVYIKRSGNKTYCDGIVAANLTGEVTCGGMFGKRSRGAFTRVARSLEKGKVRVKWINV